MAFLAIFFIVIGVVWTIKNEIRKAKLRRMEAKRPKTEGEIMVNKYVLEHERKMKDDSAYEEYLEWCKFHGELPLPKSDFDKFRHNEWKFEQKIKKAMR